VVAGEGRVEDREADPDPERGAELDADLEAGLNRVGAAGVCEVDRGPGGGAEPLDLLQSALDRAVGFRMLIDRLDTGRWSDTSLPALRSRGAEIARTSPVDLGEQTLFDPGPLPPPPGRWDFRNWGTYDPNR
jgi:hypothetical protein